MVHTGSLLRAATSRRLAANMKAKATLSTKRCLGIVNRLGEAYLKDLPCKLHELVKRIRQGLVEKGKRHLEPEKATAILWKVLREINVGLETLLKEAQATLDNADAEREARVAAAADAEVKLVELQQAVVEHSRELKDTLKAIESRRAAIVAKRATRQSKEAEAKKLQSRKRHLELVERECYAPLKRAPADGHEGGRHLAILRRTGKAFGFHKELLGVAPVVLRKQLDARHSFDNLIVAQIASEFSKHAKLLEANGEDSEKAALNRALEVREAEQELMNAKMAHKKAKQVVSAMASSVSKARQAVTEAKIRVRRLPADLKRAERAAEQIEARLLKFQRGPRAAFENALGLEFGAVTSMAEGPGKVLGSKSMDRLMDA